MQKIDLKQWNLGICSQLANIVQIVRTLPKTTIHTYGINTNLLYFNNLQRILLYRTFLSAYNPVKPTNLVVYSIRRCLILMLEFILKHCFSALKNP